MKLSKWFFAVLLILLLLIAGEAVALALNTGFSTNTLPEEDVNRILRNISLKPLSEEPPRNSIECFDVDEDGTIAIGCKNHGEITIAIYSNSNEFQYGYSLDNSDRSTFGIELDKGVLMIYFVRSDIAITVKQGGEIESVLEIQNTSENSRFWRKNVYPTKRTVGDNTYVIKNDMGFFNLFASSYSQLVVINATGEETIIYDVNSTQLLKTAVTFFAVLIFVGIIIYLLMRQFIDINRKKEPPSGIEAR